MITHNICFHGEVRKIKEALLLVTNNICLDSEIRKISTLGPKYLCYYLL